MERYIDADKFAEMICESPAIDEHSANAVIFMLRNQPTADVVEIVRCKDCKHWGCVRSTMIGGRVGNCYNDAYPFHCEQPPIMKPDDYCSYGERKSDG